MKQITKKKAAASKARPAANGPALAALYEPDETAWLEESSRCIRAGRLDCLDYENLASYLEDMARRDRREIQSRLGILIAHLLKWHYQADKRTRSWELTILNQRFQLEGALTKTLEQHAHNVLEKAYRAAVKLAAAQTRCDANIFPAECPYTLEQIMTEELA